MRSLTLLALLLCLGCEAAREDAAQRATGAQPPARRQEAAATSGSPQAGSPHAGQAGAARSSCGEAAASACAGGRCGAPPAVEVAAEGAAGEVKVFGLKRTSSRVPAIDAAAAARRYQTATFGLG
ncbi:MAG: hypothetical protein AB7N76_16435 [Planctomycetota bacterium]